MNIEDKYLNERAFGLDTDSLSKQANKSIKMLEKPSQQMTLIYQRLLPVHYK